MNTNRLVSFDVYLVGSSPEFCDPYVLRLPPDLALHICAFADGAVIKLVPVYELPSVPTPENKE